jgi:hypothetical protein
MHAATVFACQGCGEEHDVEDRVVLRAGVEVVGIEGAAPGHAALLARLVAARSATARRSRTIDAACAATELHYTTVRRARTEAGVEPPRVDRHLRRRRPVVTANRRGTGCQPSLGAPLDR